MGFLGAGIGAGIITLGVGIGIGKSMRIGRSTLRRHTGRVSVIASRIVLTVSVRDKVQRRFGNCRRHHEQRSRIARTAERIHKMIVDQMKLRL